MRPESEMKECPTCKRCYEDSHVKCPHDQSDLLYSMPGPTVIDGKYQVLSCLGRGGMGTVYRAEHIHLGRQFAVKTVLPDFAHRDPTAIDRFRQEARAAAAIQHANVVGVTDFGITEDKVFYLVMEYVEGLGLQDIIAVEGPLTPERTVKIMKQVCSGVGAAHRLNMIHRDLKPSNIMISRPVSSTPNLEDMGLILGDDITGTSPSKPSAETAEPIIKVLDFGLAKILNSEILGSGPATLGTGVMGTPHYMSPEQCNGKAVDPRSDIYSLGVVVFQMLTKEVPFKGDSFGAIVSGHLMKDPPSLRTYNPLVSADLEAVVLRAMTKDPAGRQQTVAQLADELEAAVSRKPSEAVKQSPVLFIQSQPGNCDVYVNNSLRGKTGPQGKLALRLDPDEYRIRLTCPGWFDLTRTITVSGPEQSVEFNLTHKTASEAGSLAGGYRPSTSMPTAAAVQGTTARQRPQTTGGYSTPSRPFPATQTHAEPYPAVANRYDTLPLDLILAVLCAVLAFGAVFAVAPTPDPFSVQYGSSIAYLSGTGAIVATLGALFAMLIADYQFPYQPTPTLGVVFGLSRIVFAVTVILATVIAPVGALLNKWEMPSPIWFAVRVALIALFSYLYTRVRVRRRAPIV